MLIVARLPSLGVEIKEVPLSVRTTSVFLPVPTHLALLPKIVWPTDVALLAAAMMTALPELTHGMETDLHLLEPTPSAPTEDVSILTVTITPTVPELSETVVNEVNASIAVYPPEMDSHVVPAR